MKGRGLNSSPWKTPRRTREFFTAPRKDQNSNSLRSLPWQCKDEEGVILKRGLVEASAQGYRGGYTVQ